MTDRLVIVDGYNLILRTPQLRPGDDRTLAQSREKLENLLSWATDPAVRFLVIYDGAQGSAPPDEPGRVRVRFSRPPQKADDLIRALVEEWVEKAEHVTVVTADIEVARHARAMGAAVSLSDLFVSSLLGPVAGTETPAEKPVSLSKKEIEEWAEVFRRGRPPGDGEGTEH